MMAYDACVYNPDGDVLLEMERQFPGLSFSVFYLSPNAPRVRSHVLHQGADPFGGARTKEEARAEKLAFLDGAPRLVLACKALDSRDIEFIVSSLRLAIEKSRRMLFVTPISIQPLINACAPGEREVLKASYQSGLIDFLKSYDEETFRTLFSGGAN